MLTFSDGKRTGISGSYPFPYALFEETNFFDAKRRLMIAPVLLCAATALTLCFLYLLIENPEVTGLTAFSFGYPSCLIILKVFLQKRVKMRRSEVKIVAVAPLLIWLEHVALCTSLGLAALWANQMQGFDLLRLNVYTCVFVLALAGLEWPFINLTIARLGPGRLVGFTKVGGEAR